MKFCIVRDGGCKSVRCTGFACDVRYWWEVSSCRDEGNLLMPICAGVQEKPLE